MLKEENQELNEMEEKHRDFVTREQTSSRVQNTETFNHHTVVHSRENLFKCGQCGRKFWNIKHLNRHAILHSKEKPFKCQQCEKCFKIDKYLKNHMKIHRDRSHSHALSVGSVSVIKSASRLT